MRNESEYGKNDERRQSGLGKSVSAVHVPFIQSRINEVRDDIEKENAKTLDLDRKINSLMNRTVDIKTDHKSWTDIANDNNSKSNGGFSLVQVFAVALLFILLGNRLAS